MFLQIRVFQLLRVRIILFVTCEPIFQILTLGLGIIFKVTVFKRRFLNNENGCLNTSIHIFIYFFIYIYFLLKLNNVKYLLPGPNYHLAKFKN